MIYLHIEDTKKATTWTDTLESLVKSAHEAAFRKERVDAVESENAGTISRDRQGWYTENEDVLTEAVRQGYKVERDDLMTGRNYILFYGPMVAGKTR